MIDQNPVDLSGHQYSSLVHVLYLNTFSLCLVMLACTDLKNVNVYVFIYV